MHSLRGVFSDEPDAGYRLSDADRQTLPAAFSPERVQELLSYIRPEHRAELLRSFTAMPRTGPIALGPVTAEGLDPRIAAMFESLNRP